MPRTRITPAPAPRPIPQFINDEAYVQERRTQFGRDTWYNPVAVRKELASIIRRSRFYNELSASEVEYTERSLADWENYNGGYGSFNLRTEKAWTVGVDINFSFRSKGLERVEGEDGRYIITPTYLEISVNWSSTSRSLSSAQAAISLYQEATNLGCLVNAKADEYAGHTAEIYRMIPNPAYVAPESSEAVV